MNPGDIWCPNCMTYHASLTVCPPKSKPDPVQSAEYAQDMRLMEGAMLVQTEELSTKALQDAIWIIDKIASGKEATKAIDLIKRVKDAIETGELKIEPPCQTPKPAAVPSAEELIEQWADAESFHDFALTHGAVLRNFAKYAIRFAAAQRQAGREERAGELEAMHEAWCDDTKERYAALEEAAKLAKETLEYVKKYIEGQGLSAEDDCAEAVEAINKALSDLDEARKGEKNGR